MVLVATERSRQSGSSTLQCNDRVFKVCLWYCVSGSGEETEVGIDGWNEMDGAYAFRYTGNELGLSKSVTVKCLAIGDSLLIDAVSSDVDTPVNLELK